NRRAKKKFFFKGALASRIPSAVIARRKMGFAVPLPEWFRGSLKPIFASLVLREGMENYLCLPEVQRIWREHQSGLHDHSRKLWTLLMLAAWDARHFSSARDRLQEDQADRSR